MEIAQASSREAASARRGGDPEPLIHIAGSRSLPASESGGGAGASQDQLAELGAVLDRVMRADVVIFDGRQQQGFEAGAELMYARIQGMPVVAVCPDESPYRGDPGGADAILVGMCDHIARSMREARAWACSIMRGPHRKVAHTPDAALAYFHARQAPS